MSFALRVFLSFIIGGAWVSFVSVAAERKGSRLGGYLGGMPSTLVVALLFIALSQGQGDAARASKAVPAAFAVNALFILVYARLSKHGFYKGMISALLIWVIFQSALVMTGGVSLFLSVVLWIIMLLVSYYYIKFWLKIKSKKGVKLNYSRVQIAMRAVLSGLIVAAALVSSRLWGAHLGGVLASLPIVFMSTLYISSRSVSIEFSRSLARSLLFSGVINCGVFALLFIYTLGFLHPLLAAPVSYFITALLALFIYKTGL